MSTHWPVLLVWNEAPGHQAHKKEGGWKGACPCLQRPLRGLAHWLHCRVAVEVVTTMTSADVMWQDGSVECNIRSNDLFPVHHLDNNEFCPGDFVVDKRGSAGSRQPLLRRAGRAWETGKGAGLETPVRVAALWRTGGAFSGFC